MEDFYKEYRERIGFITEKYKEKNASAYMRNDGSIEYITFGETADYIRRLPELLGKYGLESGDRIAVLSQLSPYVVIKSAALTCCGITVVPLDASLPLEEVEKLMLAADVKAVMTEKKIHERLSGSIRDQLTCFDIEGLSLDLFEGSRICSKKTSDPDNEVIAIIYSSGTTGVMKGIMVTYKGLVNARKLNEYSIGLKDWMTYLLVLPFNHIAGFVSALVFFLMGCEIDFIEDVDSTKLQAGFKTFNPHCFVIVPKVYEVMEQKIRAKIKEKGAFVYKAVTGLMSFSGFLRRNFGINTGRKLFKSITDEVFGTNIINVGTGASPCKADTAAFFLNLGVNWANFYATTETNVPIASTGMLDRYPAGTEGNVNVHPDIKIKISRPDENGVGEITAKSILMMKGYFRAPELTAEAFDEEGYFKTGDYGYIDKKGYLHITGRIKESIVLSNGKKVSPADVDDYYLEREGKYDIACRGLADKEGLYDEAHLFVADNGFGKSMKAKIVSEFEEISRNAPSVYKLAGIHFVPQIPRTSVGKVKRFCLEANDDMVQEEVSKAGAKTVEDAVFAGIRRIMNLKEDFPLEGSMRLKEDIGMDSLNVFELCVELDELYGVSVEPSLREGMTVSDIGDIIENGGEIEDELSDTSSYPAVKSEKDVRAFRRFISLSHKLWNIKVMGLENVAPEERYIFCPNHECHFDGMWITGALDSRSQPNICSIAADYLFKNRIYRRGTVFMGGIPVHRGGNSAPAMKRALECITNEGYSLLIHPEGTRTPDGKLGEFKHGAAKLSIDSGLRIVPVAISGAYELFPRNRLLPRLFNWKKFRKYEVRISFGVPISPEGRDAAEITSDIKKQIEKLKLK